MKKENQYYQDDFTITADEFLSRLEVIEKNRIIQQSLLRKNNVITFPKNVPIQKVEARI
jgi:hypothetical protein